VDLQGIERTGSSDFLDGYHLAPAAAERFSKALGTALVDKSYAHAALWNSRIHGFRTGSSGVAAVGSGTMAQ
jgi:hypothetical protein